mmetsp:Transcript_42925/g.100813  ORF Transcript_42925/g.100813 Transcript_42925/m.100813 type:complete len:280 (+) Transcript_42925:656-1495(+)
MLADNSSSSSSPSLPLDPPAADFDFFLALPFRLAEAVYFTPPASLPSSSPSTSSCSSADALATACATAGATGLRLCKWAGKGGGFFGITALGGAAAFGTAAAAAARPAGNDRITSISLSSAVPASSGVQSSPSASASALAARASASCRTSRLALARSLWAHDITPQLGLAAGGPTLEPALTGLVTPPAACAGGFLATAAQSGPILLFERGSGFSFGSRFCISAFSKLFIAAVLSLLHCSYLLRKACKSSLERNFSFPCCHLSYLGATCFHSSSSSFSFV